MEIIDNINRLLGDELKSTIARGSKLRIAASTFSIYAFEALREELEGLDALEFIFTAPTFVADQSADRFRKERREFFIPKANRESSLYGTQFEIRLRNKLTQRAIARECANWIRSKATFRSNATGAPMQQFAVVDERAAFIPLQGFTSADLGYEKSDAVSNFVNKIDEAPQATTYVQIFDQIWSSPQQVEDITNLVHDHIASVYAENSPERIYFLVLYNLFAEFLEDISEDVLPNDLTGYQGHGNLDPAVRVPARRGYRDHQQARDVQRMHPRRQRRPREDVHGSRGHQVLRAAQQVGARSRS